MYVYWTHSCLRRRPNELLFEQPSLGVVVLFVTIANPFVRDQKLYSRIFSCFLMLSAGALVDHHLLALERCSLVLN